MIGNPLKVKDLVSELSRGGIRIPEIQRTYVWRRTQIAKLLDSIYYGFPSGSILLWDTSESPQFRDIATNLGRDTRSDFIPKIVLDGQQRITSLGRVFDPSTPRHERILFNVSSETFEPYSPRSASDPHWVDITEFLADPASEFDYQDRLEQAGVVSRGDPEARKEILNHLKRLSAIREYQFPVEIVREDNLETVTEIFIRANSGGTRLREAELALARLAWKLPGSIVGPFEKMEEACGERGFNLDSRFLMRSLVSIATGQSRFTDLKTFWDRPAAELEAAWKKTEKGLKAALDFVEGNVGIPGSEFLPSAYTLFPLIAVFSRRDSLSGAEERVLGRWFLVANAFSRYSSSPETTLNQDLTVLGSECKNVEGLLEQLFKALRGLPMISAQDLERAGTASPFFPISYLAAIRRDATDWFKGIKIRRDSFSEDHKIEYHHIFPKRLLNARGMDRYLRDEMANLAFLGQKANNRIRATEPKVYLAEIASHDPKRLEAQFVPMDPSLWELDQFESFLAARRQLLADAMNQILAEPG